LFASDLHLLAENGRTPNTLQEGLTMTTQSHAGTQTPDSIIPQGAPDWGIGHYEEVASAFLPAARTVVDTAAIQRQERVLDLGCGTGNAALLAAAFTAGVVGVDPAGRLLEVARSRAAAAGDGTTRFLAGRAEELPLRDAEIDVALSVFGIIFAADPEAAAAELSRVLSPHGRVVLAVWLPQGTVFRYVSLQAQTIRQALGAPATPPPFRWEDQKALTALLAPHGFQVRCTEHSLAYTGASPEAFMDHQARNHPLAVAGQKLLEQTGAVTDLRDQLLEILRDGNEDPEAFRATSRYVVVEAHRTT
jgi:SAM-dependent methyltransferase